MTYYSMECAADGLQDVLENLADSNLTETVIQSMTPEAWMITVTPEQLAMAAANGYPECELFYPTEYLIENSDWGRS